jgi:hypothetical protein
VDLEENLFECLNCIQLFHGKGSESGSCGHGNEPFEVFTAVKIYAVLFWPMTRCSLVDLYESMKVYSGLIFRLATLMMATVCLFEILVHIYQTTRCHIPEGQNPVINIRMLSESL